MNTPAGSCCCDLMVGSLHRYSLLYLLCICWLGHRFDGSESVVIVAAQKRTLGGRELQLPCMSSLTSKTSTQKFFLRVLQVIIQLREDTRRANKKAKQTGRIGTTATAHTQPGSSAPWQPSPSNQHSDPGANQSLHLP